MRYSILAFIHDIYVATHILLCVRSVRSSINYENVFGIIEMRRFLGYHMNGRIIIDEDVVMM